MNGMQGHCYGGGNDRLHDRIELLEGLLVDAQSALIPYMRMVTGTEVPNQAAQVYDKIDKALRK
jgi:hypothetical protein